MDKRVTTRSTSFPAASDSSDTSTKNDSFLEDMDLISHNSKICKSREEAQRFITTRTSSSDDVPLLTVSKEEDISCKKNISQNIAYLKGPPLQKPTRREVSNADKPQSSGDGNSQTGTSMAKELKAKIQESKSRSLDNKSKTKPRDIKVSENHAKMQSDPDKLHQDRKSVVKDHSRRSGSCKESDQSAEAFKENKQPPNSQKQISSPVDICKEHSRRSNSGRKSDTRKVDESVGFLNAVREIVSSCTRKEGMEISRTLNELHILSQASLIKNLMFATDEIRKDLQIGENLGQLKVLLAENERLRENFAILKIKNEDLQRRLEESEDIKEENARLKLRLHELDGRRSS